MSKKNSLDKLSRSHDPKYIVRSERARGRRLRRERANSEPLDDKGIIKTSSSVFGLVLIFLIFVALARYLNESYLSDLNFRSLLDFLSNAPSFDMSWSMVDLTIYGDWGWFNFLREFFNWFTAVFEVLLFIFGAIVEMLEYLIYFVRGLLFP